MLLIILWENDIALITIYHLK